MSRPVRAALLGCVALFLSCSSKETTSSSASSSGASGTTPPNAQPPVTTLFSKAIESVTVEIAYAAGAEPYAGTLKDFGDPWSLFRVNALSVFDGKKKVTVPTTLARMAKLEDVPAKNFTNKDLLDLAAAHRTEPQYANAVAFYVVFVNGYWVDDAAAVRKDILGVSIADTGVIGMFKPAIASAGNSPPQLVEQLTLIHHFGHAVGFVDNGVPVEAGNRAHVDPENAHHCTNKQCAMSFATETPAGASAFAGTVRSPQAVLIGQECLSDARILENKQ